MTTFKSDPPQNNLPPEAQQWRRWIEEVLANGLRAQDIRDTNLSTGFKNVDSIRRVVEDAGLNIDDHEKAIKESRRIPAAPANPQIATDAYFAAAGYPQASVAMTTDVVTMATDGGSMTIKEYQMEGRPDVLGESWRTLASYVTPSLTCDPLPAGQDWRFRVRAIGTLGQVGEPSAEMVVRLAKDTTPPPKPSKMTATARLGQVVLTWDGLTEAGATQPPDFVRAEVYMSTSLSGGGTRVENMLGAGTSVVSDQPYNQVRWFWLVAVDNSGNRSEAGERVSCTVTPLVDTDVIGQIIKGANIVDGSVSAADKIIGNTITGGLIQGNAINAGHLQANAVTADKVVAGAITGAKIAADTITGDKIRAGTISATKVNVGTAENLIADARFGVGFAEGGNWFQNAGETWFIASVGGVWQDCVMQDAVVSGTYSTVRTRELIPVKGGQPYLLEVGIHTQDWSGSRPFARITWRDKAGALISTSDIFADGTAWKMYQRTVTAPTTAVSCYLDFSTSASSQGRAILGVPKIMPLTPGELIVDGAITADKIQADAITASKIQADAINGMTITGATVRTNATGNRTEMTRSGIQIIRGSNVAVQLGYNVDTGMAVRNPASGDLIALAPLVFGTAGGTNAGALGVPKPASTSVNASPVWGTWVDNWVADNTPISSPTGRILMICSMALTDIPQAQNYRFESVFDLMEQYNNNAAAYIRIYNQAPLTVGANVYMKIVNVTPNKQYWLRCSARCMMYSNYSNPWVGDRTMIAMPI